ncbi:large ribosomal subunit protein uL29m [Lepisosteus oculatus]|uniref:Large ribosomal subunit protein uL29m n=1 Tax=Lepisosteus oculatus TaxID=7918 RepID=W5LZA3_LEPOC|nr:PREDICTED: 39S ribosomal protein L47, mitochondrial [Lepisosteus oculatus]
MAATSLGRVLSLCRQFQKGLGVCSVRHASFPPNSLSLHPLSANAHTLLRSSVGTGLAKQCRAVHASQCRRGLEDFFDSPQNWGAPTVKSGAPWTAKQLRTKSNEDLHKLWYVLLKEKNMLLTVEQEAKRQRTQMPSPERLKKVERSMIRLDTVVKEREDALRLLQTGQERARPGAWRKHVFGWTYWYRFKEWAIPWYMNRRYTRKRFFTPPFVSHFIRLRIEKRLRIGNKKKKMEADKQLKLREKFPKQAAKL